MKPSATMRLFAALLVSASIAASATTGRADTPRCGAAVTEPRSRRHDATLAEAQARAHSGDSRGYAEARGLYLYLLARNPRDDEALTGLGRVDAWDGCLALSELSYREVLSHDPRQIEARAGLVDILFWQSRFEEGEELLREGLALTPLAPELLARRARMASWRGDARKAVADAELAGSLAPSDEDLKNLRDRMYTGEARAYVRGDFFPASYPNLWNSGLALSQAYKRFRFTWASDLVQRSAGSQGQAVLDWRRTVGVSTHTGIGLWAGLELGHGTPARAIPEYTLRASVLVPLLPRATGSFAYSAWFYPNDKTVHIFNPALGFALSDSVRIDLRWWTAHIVIAPPSGSAGDTFRETVHSAGLQGTWRARSRLDLSASYTYGVQLDQNPALFQLIELRSHIVAFAADILLAREYGVRPLVGFEERSAKTGASAAIISLESGFYLRW